MKSAWGHGPWGRGHIIYCDNGCLVCVLPVAVLSKGYIPRPMNKKDRAVAREEINQHACQKEGEEK